MGAAERAVERIGRNFVRGGSWLGGRGLAVSGRNVSGAIASFWRQDLIRIHNAQVSNLWLSGVMSRTGDVDSPGVDGGSMRITLYQGRRLVMGRRLTQGAAFAVG